MDGWYILVDGKPTPVDMETYARWDATGGFTKKIVARTYLSRDGAEAAPYKDVLRKPRGAYACVSTVFLGMDHGYAWHEEGAAPLLYETMVAVAGGNPDKRGGLDFLDPQWRYTTAEEARAMHARVVAYAQERLRAGSDLRDEDGWPEE